MKKIKVIIFSLLSSILLTQNSSADGFGMGVTASFAQLDVDGKEDVDSNGTTDATKNVSDDVFVGSIFAEYTFENLNSTGLALTVGADYIPVEADIDKRSITQTTISTADPAVVTSGTNSVEGTVKDHFTVYIQPGSMINDSTMVYGTLGYAFADLNGKSTSLTHTNISESKDLEGIKYGIGVKKYLTNAFVKFDISKTDYDDVSFTTSNNTKATADLDVTMASLSIGKQF